MPWICKDCKMPIYKITKEVHTINDKLKNDELVIKKEQFCCSKCANESINNIQEIGIFVSDKEYKKIFNKVRC